MREGERREKKSSYEQCINSEYVREARAGGSPAKRALLLFFLLGLPARVWPGLGPASSHPPSVALTSGAKKGRFGPREKPRAFCFVSQSSCGGVGSVVRHTVREC